MSDGWKIAYLLLSYAMMIMAIIGCIGGELIETVLFVGISIWVVLSAMLFKE